MRSSWRIRFGMAFVGACLAIFVVAVGASAAGTSPIGESASSEQPTTSEQPSPNEVKPVRELPELRTADSDTFAQADGTRLLKISLHQLNYQVTVPGSRSTTSSKPEPTAARTRSPRPRP
jgi:hypothetical protein